MKNLYLGGGKRALDLIFASGGLAVLLPVMAITAAAIRGQDGGPMLFRQERSGVAPKTFIVLKFRSMPVGTEALPSATARGLSPTPVGRLIRRLNIDELPQLINVIRGEMSIVGPRPALLTQGNLLELRLRGGAAGLRPGLTGLAQVNAYDGMTEAEKAIFDIRYAQNVTLWMDLRIIWATLGYLTRQPPVY